MKVKLKHPKSFNFNKKTGHFHFYYDLVKKRLGLKKQFISFDSFKYNEGFKFYLKDLKGNVISHPDGSPELFSSSLFEKLKA
jgi:hypothetical protein